MNSAIEWVESRPCFNRQNSRVSNDVLTQGQIECLLLVEQHCTSKEIASALHISPHTVDQRIRVAMRALRVTRRREAARIVAEHHDPMFQWSTPFVVHPITPQTTPIRKGVPLPFATRLSPRNEMSLQGRLAWIVAIAFGAAAAAGMYLAGLESLSRLLAGR
jgi:DNA-binding CsgD family transcriptional regulator